jgi:DNA repair protein RecO (recombination protein O)
MALTQDEAIALRRLDYSETSQVLVFLTREHGKVRAIAKGVKRGTRSRFAVGIDLLELGHVVVSARPGGRAELATVTEWKQTRSMTGLRQRLARLHAAEYAAEVTAALTEDWDPHPRVFAALVGLLDGLCQANQAFDRLVDFQRELLDEIGSLPDFAACLACGRVPDPDEPVHFSSFEGGLLCRDCEPAHVEKRELLLGCLSVLRGQAGEPASQAAAFDILNYHIAHLIGRNPTTAPILQATAPHP